MKKLQILMSLLLQPRDLRTLLSLRHRGYLIDIGWFQSAEKKMPMDKNGQPIPWYSYPFLNFIEPRLRKHFDVFEYGSGNSTIWLAERVGTVKSVEHNSDWFKKLSLNLPANVKIVYREQNGKMEYCHELLNTDLHFDIVIVDGVERNCCLKVSVEKLKKDGVVILDNSERPEYQEGIQYILSLGFKKIDFCGMGATENCLTCTSVFYKDKNCLNI